ncbi:unnamed protein product, partial [Mesorhabditis spiculigera]
MEAEPPKDAQMGVWTCMAYVVGNIVGSGVFITPGGVLEQTGSIGLSLAVWLGCGVISIMGAFAYIELATAIPDPGCDFAYSCYLGWEGVAFAFMLLRRAVGDE